MRRLAVLTPLLVVAGCVVVGGAAGCGVAGSRATHSTTAVPAASASQWDPTKMPDPCRVISQPEVAGALGTAVSPGTRLQTWPPLCRFVIDHDSETFVYFSDDSRPTAADDFEHDGRTTNVTQQVTGLGDRAYWLPQLTTLHVLSTGTHLVVMFRGGKIPSGAQDAAVRLARIALPRARP